MLVRELIERLEEMPPEAKVMVSAVAETEIREVEDITENWTEPMVLLS